MILNKIRALKRSKFAIGVVVLLLLAFALSRTFRNIVFEHLPSVATENASAKDKTLSSEIDISFQLSQELAARANEISVKNPEIPTKVISVLAYIRAYGQAPEAYAGGDRFFNREGLLPEKTSQGKKIKYQKWDVNPRIRGENRGAERLVTSERSAFYTADHYNSFIKIIE
jgi:guanyl-specific ribonuclease Sa